MKVDLSKEDLIRLLKGTSDMIGYGLMDYLAPIGTLTGFPNEKWYWDNSALEKMTEESIYEIYKHIIKNI